MPDVGLDEATVRRIFHEELQPVQRSVDKIKHCLEGPEGDPGKGVIVRLDRIEQNEKRRGWWIGSALLAGMTALTKVVMDWLTGRQS